MNRAVLITGASVGIGAALVRHIAEPGTALLLHTRRNADGLERSAAAARMAGATVETAMGDLADPEEPARIVSLAAERFGRLDQVVSNAGFANRRRFGEVTQAELRAALGGITEAFFGLATAALPHLEASPCGRVVAVSSFVAHVYGTADNVYPVSAAAKAGLEALAKALAYQLAPKGVTVNCVSPGYTRKDAGAHAAMQGRAWDIAAEATPMKKLGEPSDVAAMIAFLLRPEAGHVTGQIIHVDGGLTLL